MIRAVALPLIGVGVAPAVDTFDSGWAVSEPAPKSVLESPRVPVNRLLPADAIKDWSVRAKPQVQPAKPQVSQAKPTTDELKWRSRSGQPTPGASQPKATTPAQPIVGPDRSAQRERLSDDIAGAFALPGATVTPAPPEVRAGEPKTSATTPKPLREPAPFPGLPTPPPKTEAPRVAQATPQPKAPQTAGPRLFESQVEAPVEQAEPVAPVEQETATEPAEKLIDEEPIDDALTAEDLTDEPVVKKDSTKAKPAQEPAEEEIVEEEIVEEDEEELSTRTPAKARASQKADSRLPAKRPATSANPAEQKPAAKPAPKQTATRDRSVPGVGIYGALRPDAEGSLKPLSRSEQYLRRRLRSVLSYYYRRPLNNRDHDPWEVMHGMLAYGLHSRLLDTSDRGKPVTAIGYLCYNKPCKRKRLLHLTPDGQIDADVAYGLQGHRGQFLAMLAQCNVSPDYPVRIEDKEFTIHDLVDYEMRTCSSDIELTFKLIALAHYLDLEETWTSEDGERWSISRLIAEERRQKIRGAPCGGTHRLSGIALAAVIREARGEPLNGEFLEARRFTQEQQAYAFRLQNRDGSLSTEWFRGPGAEEDINRRVRTTGHILEWLLYSLPEDQLKESNTVRAVNYLTSLLASNTENAWEAGPLSHALHALMLYDERVFQPYDEAERQAAAKGQTNAKAPTLSYQSITSRVYGTYPSAEDAEKAREEAENPGGLRALFGIGRSNSRRSR